MAGIKAPGGPGGSVAHACAAGFCHQLLAVAHGFRVPPGAFFLVAPHLLFLLQLQGRIDLIDAADAALHRRQHLLLQQRELLLAVGMLDPGAAQGPAGMGPEQKLNRLAAGFQQQEGIILR